MPDTVKCPRCDARVEIHDGHVAPHLANRKAYTLPGGQAAPVLWCNGAGLRVELPKSN